MPPWMQLAQQAMDQLIGAARLAGARTAQAGRAFGESLTRDTLPDLLVGADPTFGVASSAAGIQSRNPNFAVQIAGSLLVPGVPGGPVFKRAGQLMEGLFDLSTGAVSRIKMDATRSLQDALFGARGVVDRAPSASGSIIENRSLIELEILNDATEVVLLTRALRNDPDAFRYAKEGIDEEIRAGALGINLGPQKLTEYINDRIRISNENVMRNDQFLDLLDQVGQ